MIKSFLISENISGILNNNKQDSIQRNNYYTNKLLKNKLSEK
jgi:hypothetical protein